MIYIGRLRDRFRPRSCLMTLKAVAGGEFRSAPVLRSRPMTNQARGPVRVNDTDQPPDPQAAETRDPRGIHDLPHRCCQNPHSSAGLQSMCSILQSKTGPRQLLRSTLGTDGTCKSLIINVICRLRPSAARLFHFGSGNAYSFCNEEAATFWTTPSIALTSHRSFLPRKRRPIEFPLIPA
jgi:hypothetical protein